MAAVRKRRSASKLTLKSRRKKTLDLQKVEKGKGVERSSIGSPISVKRGSPPKKVGRGRPKKLASPSRQSKLLIASRKSSPKVVRKSPIRVRSTLEDRNPFHVETPKTKVESKKRGRKPGSSRNVLKALDTQPDDEQMTHNPFHSETPKKTRQRRQAKKSLKLAPKPLKSKAKKVVKSPTGKVQKKKSPRRKSRLSLPRRKKSISNKTTPLAH